MFRKGAVSVEFLINFIIYLVMIIILFSVSILPLQKLFLEHNLRKVALILFQTGHLNNQLDIYKAGNYAFKFIGLDSVNNYKNLKEIINNYLRNTTPKDTFVDKLFNIEDFIKGYDYKINSNISNIFLPNKVEITIYYPLTFFGQFDLGFWVKDKFIGLGFKRTIYIYINK